MQGVDDNGEIMLKSDYFRIEIKKNIVQLVQEIVLKSDYFRIEMQI